MKMLARAIVALSLIILATSSGLAQWQVSSHAIPLGKGAGVLGFGSIPPAATSKFLVGGGTGADPVMQTMSGDCSQAAGVMTCKGQPVFNVKNYGAVGDGSTNDSSAFSSAFSACASAGGGVIYVPPTGASYKLNSGQTIAKGCSLVGASTRTFEGLTATLAQWTDAGSWIQCADTTNPCLDGPNNGWSIKGMNFIYVQPTPTGGSWTPTAYPYTITTEGSMFTIDDVQIIANTHGIQVNFGSVSGGGSYSRISHVSMSGFNVCMQVLGTNDVLSVHNIQCENLWYESDSRVVTYMLANAIGFDVHYWDNAFVSDVQWYKVKEGMLLTDGTVQGFTHSLFNGQFTNINCNLVVRCVSVASGSTTAWAQFTNFTLQTGTSAATEALNLGSNNVDFNFTNLVVNDAGKSILTLGNGTGGKAAIDGLKVKSYSSLTSSNAAFNTAAGSTLTVPGGSLNIVGSTSPLAGAVFNASGTVNTLPAPTTSLLGGVKSKASVSHQFLTQLDTTGTFSSAAVALGDLPTQSADTVLGNFTGSSAVPSAGAVNSCSGSTSALTYNTSTHAFGCNTLPGTVTSLSPGAGTTSTLTATAPGSAVTSSGTLSAAQLVNAQTGTSYAIVDGDRAKLVTASNAAAQAYTIAQAGTSSAFQSGWYVDLRNKSTNVAGIVTITPTTSTINGASSLALQPGQSVRIVSDGTNYQAYSLASGAQLPGTAANDNANAGNVGEFMTSNTATGAMSNGVTANAGSVTLTAGDWDVYGYAFFSPAATTSTTEVDLSISTTSGALDSNSLASLPTTFTANRTIAFPLIPRRASISSSTTYYCTLQSLFTVSTMSGQCILYARRAR